MKTNLILTQVLKVEEKVLALQKQILVLQKQAILLKNKVISFFRKKNVSFVLKKRKNKGEDDEVLLLRKIFLFNEICNYDELVKIFGNEASEGIQLLSLDTENIITDINKLTKARSIYKADCIIKMNKNNCIYSASIKSKRCGYPAILNHTKRNAKVFMSSGILHCYLNSLDIILKEYIDKRYKKIFNEDVKITDLDCIKNLSIKSDFCNVLLYFLFNGTGKGYSNRSADSIIEYKKNEIKFIKCCSFTEKKEYINEIFDRIIISLRNKSMPKVINDTYKPWVFNENQIDGSIKYKGQLHIRVK